jgi:glutathione reductase (NADPH)
VTGIEQKADGGKVVQFSGGDCLPCDLVVHGAGRVPNVKQLNLDAGNVEATERGIVVDEYLRSRSNPAVHALGDCAATASPQLTPVANRDAEAVVRNLLAGRSEVKRDAGPVPKAAFTTPSIAAVGLSEREASERGLDVDIRAGDRSGWGSIRKVGSPAAGYKILIDRSTREIVGAHVLGPAAEETINLFALAMRFGVTADQFQAVPFVFPTFSSDAGSMR